MQNLKVLGIITARGGSKGIPRKNIKDLGGKPLIAWTIEAAKNSKKLTDFLVSTDDQEIADVAKSFGAPVPFMRPAELATDTATSMAVVQHALAWLKQEQGKEYDAVLILQPTSPLRTNDDIDNSIEIMERTNCDSVMGMKKLEDFSIKKLKILEGDVIKPWLEEEGAQSSSRQALANVYKRNCAIYLTKIEKIKAGDLFGADSRALVMPEDRSVDINAPFDFELAEFFISRKAQV